MEIDLDELKAAWAAQERKLDATVRLNGRLLNALAMDSVRTPLQRLTTYLVFELLSTLAAVAALGAFVYDNRLALRFAVPGAVLDVFAIVTAIAVVRQIVGIGQ